MNAAIPLEPNPAPSRRLDQAFFADLLAWTQWGSSFGRETGLLPRSGGGNDARPYFDPPEVLRLDAMQAVGERGYPILAGPMYEEEIRPLDTRLLGPGLHRIYACLTRDRTPCGELVMENGGSLASPEAGARQYRRSRRPQVHLAADEDRLTYQDWIQVAELEGVRRGGSAFSLLQEEFHPLIREMSAYRLTNPLRMLAEKGLEAMNRDEDPRPEDAVLRTELILLRNIAEKASILPAFLQTQRCLSLLQQMPKPPIRVAGNYLNYRFAPESFCEFLSGLRRELEREQVVARYPDTILIRLADRDVTHTRLAGQLEEQEDTWCWEAPAAVRRVNGLAVYFPSVREKEAIPTAKFGRQPNEPTFRVAAVSDAISAGGAALLLDNLDGEIDRVYFAVLAANRVHRFQMLLNDGHAIYYW